MLDRFVSFEGAFNVRDLGGLTTANGSDVRRGLVFRAASPRRLTTTDREKVSELGISHVLDLRTGDEAELGSWAVPGRITRHNFAVIDVMPDPENPPSDLPPVVDANALAERYAYRLRNGAATFVAAAQTLTRNAEAGVLFHCSAGKDRTGILAAFVLQALGVDDETIVEDYALSREPLQRQIEHQLANPLPDDSDLSLVAPVLKDSPAEAMRGLLEIMAREHGGIATFFADNGYGEDDLAVLRSSLLT